MCALASIILRKPHSSWACCIVSSNPLSSHRCYCTHPKPAQLPRRHVYYDCISRGQQSTCSFVTALYFSNFTRSAQRCTSTTLVFPILVHAFTSVLRWLTRPHTTPPETGNTVKGHHHPPFKSRSSHKILDQPRQIYELPLGTMKMFNDLPAEVRNTIYGQLLDRCHPRQTPAVSALFGASKQIGQESASYFHQHNAFAITAASPPNDSATILPPIADKWVRYLRRLAVYATISGANSERERNIASTIASLAMTGAKFEDLYIRIDSSLSKLANSCVDDSILYAQR